MSAQLNLRAAAEVLRSRAGASRARNAASNAKKPLSVRNATKIYKGSSSSSVQRRITQLRDGDVARQPGRPRALTDEEDESLIAFVILTQKTGFPATRGEVEDAANSLRRKRDPKAADLSRMWYPRWRQDHPELEKATLMTIDSSRESWAVGGVDDVNLFFDRLEHAIRNFRIDASTFWNTDEAGIRIGCLRNRIQCLIVRTAKRQRVQTVDPANRESCTLVGTGNAAGDTIPPWLIFKTFPTLDFSDVEADPNLRFARSDTAFNNSEIFLEWIRHFNSHSWSACTKAKQLGVTLEEWFGCNEHLRDPLHEHVQYEEPPTRRAEEDRIYRLLLLDGFTGHGSSELRLYGVKFDIIIVPLPAHSTHKLQPMDVGVFQPMKEAHQKKLRHAMRKGSISYSRLEFTKSFQDIFDTGFSRHNIMSGFEKSGMWPVDRKPILAFLEQKALQAQKSINPALPSLLPDEARFHRASVITKHISEKYHDVMSSPSRAGLRTVRKVVTEASLLNDTVNAYVDDRRARLEKAYHQKKRGKQVKPQGDFSLSVSIDDIKRQQEEAISESREKEIRAQLRAQRTFVIQEMKKIKDEWRQDPWAFINGTRMKLQWDQWLRHHGRDVEYYSMDEGRADITRILSRKPDSFYFDTGLPPEVRESIRRANFGPKPLNAVDWSALARSDDDLEITVQRPAAAEIDGDDEEEEEQLRLIEMPAFDDNGVIPRWARSSPPRESSPPPSTPCPAPRHPQHHVPIHKIITRMIQEDRAASAASLRSSRDEEIR